MRTRIFAVAIVAMLAPAAVFAGSVSAAPAPSASSVLINVKTAYTTPGQRLDQGYGRHDGDHDDYDDRGGKKCGRGNAWGCRRKNDERYVFDRRGDRWEREQYERARYARERYERQRAREYYDRERYERDRYDDRDRYYPSRPIACVRAGNRIVGGVVVTVCLP